jgi:16S rRNA (cytosine967-C5)-methyltransferase
MPFEGLGLGGLALVQDEAAQLVSLMLSPKPGQRVLDACAAPGGKTAHIAALMGDKGGIVSLDMDGARLERLMENVSAMGLKSVRVVQADLMNYEEDDDFHCVLLDAPCSATGVIRRNPDIKYRRKLGDLKRYSETQYGLLRAAAGFLRPGGRLVYAVCSTEPEEGEGVVERFLKSCADFFIIDDVPQVSSRLMQGGYMRTWPHRDGMDGFFAALLARVK